MPALQIAPQNLVDELLLGRQLLEHGRVQCILNAVLVDLHFGILIALSQYAPVPLLYVHGPRRRVQMMQRYHVLLRVHTQSHPFRAPQHNRYVAVIDFVEQRLALRVLHASIMTIWSSGTSRSMSFFFSSW